MDQLLVRYNRLFKQLDGAYRRFANALNLSETALWILYSLREGSARTQKDLCDLMHQSKQSINSALKRLEEEGCIVLTVSEENRTRKLLRLTERGEALAARTADKVIAAEERALAKLSPADAEQLLTLYGRFVQAVEDEIQATIQKEDQTQ